MINVGKCLLLDILKQKNVTQQELAEKIGVTKQQINHYIKNRRIMSIQIAANIAYVLDCEIMDLYEWHFVEIRDKRRK